MNPAIAAAAAAIATAAHRARIRAASHQTTGKDTPMRENDPRERLPRPVSPDLTPEAVERAIGMCRAHGLHGTEATLCALSAALEAERAGRAQDGETAVDLMIRHKDRADAAEAERDALKAQLAEAVGVMQMIVGGAVYTAADGFSKPHEPEQSRIARAFLASHQKETDT